MYSAFLEQHTFCNITRFTAWARLSVGLLLFWVALAVGFSMVFLDARRSTRVWVGASLMQILLPMAFAMYFLTAYMYNIDPALVLARRTQVAPRTYVRVDEPFVYRQHCLHAAGAVGIAALACAALTVLFVFVPGHRL